MRVAVDVMGGDKAPAAILKGCWEAAPLLDANDTVLLVGDQDVIRKVVGDLTTAGVDTSDEAVAEALRHKEVEARRQIIEATNL